MQACGVSITASTRRSEIDGCDASTIPNPLEVTSSMGALPLLSSAGGLVLRFSAEREGTIPLISPANEGHQSITSPPVTSILSPVTNAA